VRARTPNTISKDEGWWVGGGHLCFSLFIITPIATKPNHPPTSLYSSFSLSTQQPNFILSHRITVIAFLPIPIPMASSLSTKPFSTDALAAFASLNSDLRSLSPGYLRLSLRPRLHKRLRRSSLSLSLCPLTVSFLANSLFYVFLLRRLYFNSYCFYVITPN